MNSLRSIRFWPKTDRPRDKLLCLGEHKVTDSELLAVLIRSGTNGVSAVELARQVLGKFGCFRGLSNATLKEWSGFKGLGPAKIAQIKAAIEIGRRFQEQSLESVETFIESSRDIVHMFMGRMRDLRKEVVKIVLLDSRNKIITTLEIEEGTVNYAHPILREIFTAALEHGASALICIHNHPAGDPSPSPEDRRFTNDLRQTAAVLGIALLDHIIIGNNTYYSFEDSESGVSQ